MVAGSKVSACHISSWLMAVLGMKLHPTDQRGSAPAPADATRARTRAAAHADRSDFMPPSSIRAQQGLPAVREPRLALDGRTQGGLRVRLRDGGGAARSRAQVAKRRAQRGLRGVAERVLEVVRGRAIGGDAVEVATLAPRVLGAEGHRVEDLVAEVVAVLADRLAVAAVAHGGHGDERPRAVPDKLARRR